MSQSPFADLKVTADLGEYERLERLFGRSDLLKLALTHSSANLAGDYQRFEFLGDAVIELVVRKTLMQLNPEADEGELTRMKIDLVRGSALVRCADRLGLRERIVTGPDFGEELIPDSIAADVYEAVVGALFTHCGFEITAEFVNRTLIALEKTSSRGDPKSRLQEFCQARGFPLPVYRTERTTGPSHAPIFEVSVSVNGSKLGEGIASSRKNSEMIAAEMALTALEGEDSYDGLRTE